MNAAFVASKEKEFLDKVSKTYRIGDDSPQTEVMRRLLFQTFEPYLRGGRGLELGCSDGTLTEMLSAKLDALDVVDGCAEFLEQAKEKKLPNVRFFASLFEEYQPDKEYDYVFATYIFEHVFDVVPVLQLANRALKPGGRLFIVVPNARALSRQLALHMGIIQSLYALTENDYRHGHRRVYDRVGLNRDMEAAGFSVIHQGGLMLKILADFQLDQLIEQGFLGEQHIQGLYKLGLEYPDLAGSLFAIGEKPIR